MPSLGEAPITCGSQTIGKASVKHVYAYPAVYPCLGLTVGVALYHLSERLSQQQPPLRDYEIHDLNGTIGIGDAHTIVGTVNWIGPNRYVRSSDFPSDYDLTFTCDLDFGLLERMESIRGRNAPRFWLSLWPTVVHAGGFLRVEFGQVDFVVPRDTWIDALQKIRGDRSSKCGSICLPPVNTRRQLRTPRRRARRLTKDAMTRPSRSAVKQSRR
jgi:hypothetical protein